MAVTAISNSSILGGCVTNVVKNGDQKWRGGGRIGRVGDKNIDLFVLLYSISKRPYGPHT